MYELLHFNYRCSDAGRRSIYFAIDNVDSPPAICRPYTEIVLLRLFLPFG